MDRPRKNVRAAARRRQHLEELRRAYQLEQLQHSQRLALDLGPARPPDEAERRDDVRDEAVLRVMLRDLRAAHLQDVVVIDEAHAEAVEHVDDERGVREDVKRRQPIPHLGERRRRR